MSRRTHPSHRHNLWTRKCTKYLCEVHNNNEGISNYYIQVMGW